MTVPPAEVTELADRFHHIIYGPETHAQTAAQSILAVKAVSGLGFFLRASLHTAVSGPAKNTQRIVGAKQQLPAQCRMPPQAEQHAHPVRQAERGNV